MKRKEFLQKVHDELVRRRDELRRSFFGELNHFKTSEEPAVGDLADAAVDEDYGAVNSNLAELESRELAQIERALELLRQGEYGICEMCGRQIPIERLKILPFATMCVRCQQRAESAASGETTSRHRRRRRARSEMEGDQRPKRPRSDAILAA